MRAPRLVREDGSIVPRDVEDDHAGSPVGLNKSTLNPRGVTEAAPIVSEAGPVLRARPAQRTLSDDV
jgi:hypothetical protein